MDKFWKTYRTISLYLIVPAICMFVIGMFSQLLDQNPERFDRQTQGVVVSCVDKTDRTRASRENGGFMLVYQIKAEYQVDGVTYTCKETGGSPRKVGSEVTITYSLNSPQIILYNTILIHFLNIFIKKRKYPNFLKWLKLRCICQ